MVLKLFRHLHRIYQRILQTVILIHEHKLLKMLGKYFQSLNSLEYVANQFTQSLYGEWTLFDMPEIIQEIELTDVLAAGELFIKEEAFTRFYMEKNIPS